MDRELEIIRNVRGPVGMNHVRGLKDLYKARPDTLAKRVEGANLAPASRVSVFVAWAYHHIHHAKDTQLKKTLIDQLCSSAVRCQCSQDLLRSIWSDCVDRAIKSTRRNEVQTVRKAAGFVNDEIKDWFWRREEKRREDAKRQVRPGAGFDSQPWTHHDGGWGAAYASRGRTQASPALPVDDWPLVPDELYECPNCGEYGQHFGPDCPQIRFLRGTIRENQKFSEEYRRRDEAAAARRKEQEGQWGAIPPPNQRCWLCGAVGDHFQEKCPRSFDSRGPSYGQPGNDWADCFTGDPAVPSDDPRPTTELRPIGFSPEPGEVLGEHASQKDHASGPRLEAELGQRTKRARNPICVSDEEGDIERDDVDGRPDLFVNRCSDQGRLRKRARFHEEPAEERPLDYLDTNRRRLSREPTSTTTRIRRWQTEIKSSGLEDNQLRNSSDSHEVDLETNQSCHAERTEHTAVTEPNPIESESDNEQPLLPSAAAAGSSVSRSDCSSPKTTPPQTPVPIKQEPHSSPMQTIDITARPVRLPSGSRPESPPGATGGKAIKSEYEDLTDMINALEEADEFLARLWRELEAAPAEKEVDPSVENEHTHPSRRAALKAPEPLMDTSQSPPPASSGSDAFYSCADDAESPGPRHTRPQPGVRDLDLVSSCKPAYPDPESRGEAPLEYDSLVVKLFHNNAPPLLRRSIRPTAMDMWEGRETASTNEVLVVKQEAAMLDMVRIKTEGAEDEGLQNILSAGSEGEVEVDDCRSLFYDDSDDGDDV